MPKVQLKVTVENRRAANLTVLVVDYDQSGNVRVITRGWADPQNHADIARGEQLEEGQAYVVSFSLEPRQHTFSAGHRIGVIVGATDYNHTLRPDDGTRLKVTTGAESFIELGLSEWLGVGRDGTEGKRALK
jgi:X-Pro dipeptidyl-peptidase